MRLLFIGGTGVISSACAELAVQCGHDLTLLNRARSKKNPAPNGAAELIADVRGDRGRLSELLRHRQFDAVVDFIAFTPEDIERDISLFQGKTGQFVFVSSAAAYEKPPQHHLITEDTPLGNQYWEYARGKIACEQRLSQAIRGADFPATIVRPSLTYGPSQIPFCVGSWQHPWTIIDRIRSGRQVIVPGDGTSLWVLTWNADFAKGLLGLLGTREAIGEVFHITSDEVLTWDQIYLEAFAALGVHPNILHVPTDLIASYWPHALGSLRGDKTNSMMFDNSRIKKLVPEFKCETDWAHGLRQALAWHQAHPQYQTVDEELGHVMDRIVRGMQRAMPRPDADAAA